jgi:MbtH protein
MNETADTPIFTVLINHEEQYSLWPRYKLVPAGWRAVGKEGSREECCEYVDKVWTDMRPLSLRKRMAESGVAGAAD